MSHADFREVFSVDTQSAMPIEELEMVGWTRSSKARVPGLAAHTHEGALEIFLIERGSVEWWVEDEIHRVSSNQIYINRPDESHGSVGHSLKPCGYLWLILKMDSTDFPGMTRPHSEKLKTALQAIRLRSFQASAALKAAFRSLWELHRQPPSFAPALAVRAQLHLLLVLLLVDYQKASALNASTHPLELQKSFAIAQALRAIELRLPEINSVTMLARIARLNVTQFSERFLSETGYTPAHYLRLQRIEQAKRLLRLGKKNIAQIALELGFSSSQNFATVFKQIEGMPPGEFARQAS